MTRKTAMSLYCNCTLTEKKSTQHEVILAITILNTHCTAMRIPTRAPRSSREKN